MLQNAQSYFWKFLPERPTNQVHVTILNNYLGQTFAGTRPFGKPRKKKDQKIELKWFKVKIYDRIILTNLVLKQMGIIVVNLETDNLIQ